jgi:hypothetical protein
LRTFVEKECAGQAEVASFAQETLGMPLAEALSVRALPRHWEEVSKWTISGMF